jgi:hypothetical protein
MTELLTVDSPSKFLDSRRSNGVWDSHEKKRIGHLQVARGCEGAEPPRFGTAKSIRF